MKGFYVARPVDESLPPIPMGFIQDINVIDRSYGLITRLVENRRLQFPNNAFGICEAIEHLDDKYKIYFYPDWEFLVNLDLVVINHHVDCVVVILRDSCRNLLKHVLCFDSVDKTFFLNELEKLIKKSIIIKNEENDERTYTH